MTEVVLYTGVRDPSRFLAKFLKKHVVGQRRRAAVLFGSGEEARAESDRLWSVSREEFLPSCVAGDAEEGHTPVVMAAGERPPPGPFDILVNRTGSVPPGFDAFARLVEIVGGDEAALQAAREREERYAGAGHSVARHDLAGRY